MTTRSLRLIVGLAPIALLLLCLLPVRSVVYLPTGQISDPHFDTTPPTGTATLTWSFASTQTPASNSAASALATPTPTPVESTATATEISTSPLTTPTPGSTATTTAPPTPTASTLTATPTATDHIVVIVVTVTSTPLALVGPRPLEFPTPTPTADFVLVAAEVFDAAMITAGWIWFLLGSLVFFGTAGVIAGLWFRQQERRRYDLMDDEGQDPDLDRFTPLPPVIVDEAPDDEWPDSLP